MSKEEFLKSMESLLGNKYSEFKNYVDKPYFRGIYVNTLKCDTENFKRIFKYDISPTPFSEKVFYIDAEIKKIGTHPLHHAGAFYVQEPSAMSAVCVLKPQKGDIILDLCAAPGGKTTNIATYLDSEGLIWSNEYVKSRANTLLSNSERMGIRNAVISNCSVMQLASALPCFFDKILVDAPCSGEGMLRKEKAQYDDWSENNINLCATRQKEILSFAKDLLKSGGTLVYSTCTFNKEENENIINDFLTQNSDFSLVDAGESFGEKGFQMPEARRIFPMNGGEGHFVAKLKKNTDCGDVKYECFTGKEVPNAFLEFWKNNFNCEIFGKAVLINEKIYIVPLSMPKCTKLNIIRAGVLAGEIRGKNFFPHHNLYTVMKKDDCKNIVDFSENDDDIKRFLHGEEIAVDAKKGYCAVACEGIITGFGKVSDGKLKNHYPKGLRNLA